MIKIYKATTALMLPVRLDGRLEYVFFSDGNCCATVKDEKLQEAIEASSYFKSGEIKLFEQIGEKKQSKNAVNPAFDEKEFPEVTEIQQAVEVLKGEPYLVAHQSLRSPENIKKQAEVNRVKFPNLNL
jgi:hypothetical protein